jgi:DNA processing protein
MSEPSRRTLTLALAMTPGFGGKSITRVFTRNDMLGRSISEFLRYSSETLREEYRVGAKAANTWTETKLDRIKDAEEQQERLDPLGVTLVTAADAHYPRQIEGLDKDPPGLLYLYGNTRLLDSRTFCVMSSRKSAPSALDLIEKLAEEGVLSGKTLVTGDDTPEYQRSAVVPLRWGSPRILVLDRGLFKALGPDLTDETFRTARLWRYKFDPQTDLAISAIHPDGGYHRNANSRRDRLAAALSMQLDFAAISATGNMQKLAVAGLRAGRTVRVSDLTPNFHDLRDAGAQVIATA